MAMPVTSDQHDSEAFQACIVLADTVRRFLAQNRRKLDTLNDIGVLSDEYERLVQASEAAQGARSRRVEAARSRRVEAGRVG